MLFGCALEYLPPPLSKVPTIEESRSGPVVLRLVPGTAKPPPAFGVEASATFEAYCVG